EGCKSAIAHLGTPYGLVVTFLCCVVRMGDGGTRLGDFGGDAGMGRRGDRGDGEDGEDREG
ncbi:MAG: hypothetical protein AAF921_02525, partial [Cyanobacteria bacterium P01_D01_bin.44]